jgi:hypothetical protein
MVHQGADLVTRVQGPLAADALAVDEGAVARADVAHAPAGGKALEHGVQTRQAGPKLTKGLGRRAEVGIRLSGSRAWAATEERIKIDLA